MLGSTFEGHSFLNIIPLLQDFYVLLSGAFIITAGAHKNSLAGPLSVPETVSAWCCVPVCTTILRSIQGIVLSGFMFVCFLRNAALDSIQVASRITFLILKSFLIPYQELAKPLRVSVCVCGWGKHWIFLAYPSEKGLTVKSVLRWAKPWVEGLDLTRCPRDLTAEVG